VNKLSESKWGAGISCASADCNKKFSGLAMFFRQKSAGQLKPDDARRGSGSPQRLIQKLENGETGRGEPEKERGRRKFWGRKSSRLCKTRNFSP
jgi:hypothetical protein